MHKLIKLILLTWIFFYISFAYANTFNFKPVGSLPTSIQGGQTVSATYLITSAGNFPPAKYHIILAMLSNTSVVAQDLSVANACTISPINPSGCLLKLNIIGPVSGPVKVCDDWKGKPGVNCYIPANPNDYLNVKSDLSPLLTVSPSDTILAANASQVFTVFNTSITTAAANVTITIPPGVQAQLAGQPVYHGCGSIAPLGSCTITITAGAAPAPIAGYATVQGTNTAAPSPSVAITTGSAPALTISPPATVLGASGSQQFTVVNTSTTTAATNVTLAIPANVQAQLTGPPIYTGCASIAPLGSCTMTITAIASPAAASGVATAQGTNTALPAPFVAITTGAAPALTVSPSSTLLAPNGVQQFIVTNTSTSIAALAVTMTIPANVLTQLSGAPVYAGCASIAPLGTCTVTITASATAIAQSGVATVQGSNTAALAPTVTITTGAAPALTISPPATILGPNNSQQFIVTNTSANFAAQNVTMTIPANVQGQLTGLPVYSGCASIAPLGTCTVTITAVAAPNAQSGIATVQGTNTAAPAPTVAITTGAAPLLTVSPPSANMGSDDIQIFTVTNTGSIPANNITMTISANVQTQLMGLPVYSSGCTSLQPASSNCTITIQTMASPSAQSGTGTIQGTNTAAPAPVVSIFILPTCTVLGGSTVTNTGGSIVTGAVCVSPGTAIIGFPPGQTVPVGQLHSNDSTASTSQTEALTLYNSIAGLPCGTNLTGTDLGGLTLSPGVYCFSSAAALTGTLTLNGSVTDKWYFQIGSSLTTATGAIVTLTGGAVAGNVYWQIGSSGTLATNTAFIGQLIAFTSLTLDGGVSEGGRLWALNGAVTLDDNAIGP